MFSQTSHFVALVRQNPSRIKLPLATIDLDDDHKSITLLVYLQVLHNLPYSHRPTNDVLYEIWILGDKYTCSRLLRDPFNLHWQSLLEYEPLPLDFRALKVTWTYQCGIVFGRITKRLTESLCSVMSLRTRIHRVPKSSLILGVQPSVRVVPA